MELFKLLGRIVIENSEANKAIDDTGDKAESGSSKIGEAFKKIGEAAGKIGKSLQDLTGTAKNQQTELEKLKTKYQDLYLTQGAESEEAKKTAAEIEALSSELKSNKSALKEASDAADKFDRTLDGASDSADDMSDSLDDASDSAEDAESRMSEAFKKIGKVIATAFAVDKIKDFGEACINASAKISATQSAFEQIMGDSSQKASEALAAVAESTGVVEGRLTESFTSLTAKFKGLGYDTDTATKMASDGLTMAADAAAFWDMSLDESASHLNSFINGSYEGGEAIGLFANDTQLAAYAIKNGLLPSTQGMTEATEAQIIAVEKAEKAYTDAVKKHGADSLEAREAALKVEEAQNKITAAMGEQITKWAELDEATKQAVRLEYAQNMMEQSGAIGQAARESGQYANVQANLNQKWTEFQALIGEPIIRDIVIPAMSRLMELVDNLSTSFQNLGAWIQEHQTLMQLLGIAVGTLTTAIIAYNIAQNAATITTTLATAATTAFGAVVGFLTSPITLVVAAIGALIAIGVLLYKNWDEISTKAKELWGNIKSAITAKAAEIKANVTTDFEALKENISSKFEAIRTKTNEIWDKIKSGVIDKIEAARDKVQAAIDKMKSFFDFEWELPEIKLPHFKIDGKFSLNPPSIPTFSVEWYKQGGILDSPTIFGAQGANLLGGGEAGKEAVAPIDVLQGYVADAVAAQNSGISEALERMADTLDDILSSMGDDLDGRLRNTKLDLNGREFGRLVRGAL